MKVQINHKELYEAVSAISRAVSAKSALPALEGILIKTKKNSVVLVGYDLELGITKEVEANVMAEGQIVINAKLFLDIVRRMPSDIINITVVDNNTVTLNSGNSEFSIVGINASEYPEIPTMTEEERLVISQPVLKQMIRQTIFAVAVTDVKPVLKGVLFELTQGNIRLVALDGYRLALKNETINNTKEYKFIVPGKTLLEISKMLGDDEESDVTVIIGKRHILFRIGSYNVFSRLLEGEFINYQMAIPKAFSTAVFAETLSLVDMIERVSLLINDRTASPVHCIFEDNSIKAFCSTAIGKANDLIQAKITGERLEIAFNNRYMLDALRACENSDIKIELSTPLSPMVIKSTKGEDFLFLILPVKIRNEM